MKLLTVILNYRTGEMTLDAARAALVASAPVDGGTRVEIVDNDSRDGSFARMRDTVERESWERVDVVESGRNGGFGAGNNHAMRRALAGDDPPDFIYLLNSDAFPAPDAITELLTYLEAHPEVGIAGSYIHGVDGQPHLTAFRFPSLGSEVVGSLRVGLVERLLPERELPIQPMPPESQPVDWLAGASMMIRREVLESIGLFDETFFLYFEETDLCRRAALAGWPTHYVVESRVAHVGHASTGLKDLSEPMPRYWFDSRLHYFRKNHGRGYTWAANSLGALGHSIHRVKVKLQGREIGDPAHFLRDYLRYNFLDERP